jgi:hypothetical protein
MFHRRCDAHIADLKDAHELRCKELMRTIDTLAEQIEWLRLQQLRPNPASMPSFNPTELPDIVPGLPSHLSEEEEDLQYQVDQGRMTQEDMEQTLARIGLRNAHIQLVE